MQESTLKDTLASIGTSIEADLLPDGATHENMNDLESKEPKYLHEQIKLLTAQTQSLEIRNNILQEYSNSLIPERKLREKYGTWIFIGVCAYIVIVLIAVLSNHYLQISDQVLIALVGSTSINVIGLLAIVLRFVFSNHHHKILDGYNH